MTQGAWTDLYALASVVYYAIVGKTPTSSVERLMDDRLEPLAATAAGRYGAAFLRAIDAALAVRPGDRPQTEREFRALLDADLPAAPVPSATPTTPGAAATPTIAAPLGDGGATPYRTVPGTLTPELGTQPGPRATPARPATDAPASLFTPVAPAPWAAPRADPPPNLDVAPPFDPSTLPDVAPRLDPPTDLAPPLDSTARHGVAPPLDSRSRSDADPRLDSPRPSDGEPRMDPVGWHVASSDLNAPLFPDAAFASMPSGPASLPSDFPHAAAPVAAKRPGGRQRLAAWIALGVIVAALLAATAVWLQQRSAPAPTADTASAAVPPRTPSSAATALPAPTLPAAAITPIDPAALATSPTARDATAASPSASAAAALVEAPLAPAPAETTVDRRPDRAERATPSPPASDGAHDDPGALSSAAAPAARPPRPRREAPTRADAAPAVKAPAPHPASIPSRCSDILQKASLEPLSAAEAAYLKRECR